MVVRVSDRTDYSRSPSQLVSMEVPEKANPCRTDSSHFLVSPLFRPPFSFHPPDHSSPLSTQFLFGHLQTYPRPPSRSLVWTVADPARVEPIHKWPVHFRLHPEIKAQGNISARPKSRCMGLSPLSQEEVRKHEKLRISQLSHSSNRFLPSTTTGETVALAR